MSYFSLAKKFVKRRRCNENNENTEDCSKMQKERSLLGQSFMFICSVSKMEKKHLKFFWSRILILFVNFKL